MNEYNIPKIIHYCWFGKKKKPKKVEKIISSWKKKLPNYSFVEWNEGNFDIPNSCQFVKNAYAQRKWAFVSDYVRLFALIEKGGIYLDTDVEVLQSFDSFLNNNLFISHESHNSLCTAVIGSSKNNKVLKEFLKEYDNSSFEFSSKIEPNSVKIKDFFERKYKIKTVFDEEFSNNDIHIYKRNVFCGKDIHSYKFDINDETVSIHHLDATWYSPTHKILKKCKIIVRSIINSIRK